MNETSNEINNEELQQFVEDNWSELKQIVEVLWSSFEQVKEVIKELVEVLNSLIPLLVDCAKEIERRKHNSHTRQSWVVSYDTSRVSQVVYRKPRFTRKIIR